MDWTYGKLDKEVKEFLEQYNKENDYGTELPELIESLIWAGKDVWKSTPRDHRWWYEVDKVTELNGKFIMFPDATSTRDMSAQESGWLMDLGQVRFVKPVEKTIIVYE